MIAALLVLCDTIDGADNIQSAQSFLLKWPHAVAHRAHLKADCKNIQDCFPAIGALPAAIPEQIRATLAGHLVHTTQGVAS